MNWVVVLIMLIAGIFGGAVNVALQSDPATKRTWVLALVTGVGASFLTPLFLGTVSSALLREILAQRGDQATRFENLLSFGGFCLLAAITSKAFIQTLSEKVLQKVEQAERQSEAAQLKAEAAEDEVKQVRATVEDVNATAQAARDAVEYQLLPAGDPTAAALPLGDPVSAVGKASVIGRGDSRSATETIAFGDDVQDPWAGQFGGQSSSGRWRLEARLRPVVGRPDLRTVSLTVYDLQRLALNNADQRTQDEGHVTFYLHPTFANPTPNVPIIDGKAHLSVLSWGAFTVGARVHSDGTRLELNLADLPGADEPWRSR